MTVRVDEVGRAFAGSQLQIQIYVNRRPEELNVALAQASPELNGACFDWVSPVEAQCFAEFSDGAFLSALGLDEHRPALRDFWPPGGPHWDGLARVALASGVRGVVLVEAKSYVGEVYGPGCTASATDSINLIGSSICAAQAWLAVNSTSDWMRGRLYQAANRLSHLYFLREKCGLAAWLANVHFLDDPHSPTDRPAWQRGLTQIQRELGLRNRGVPGLVEVFLPALPRSVLVGTDTE